MPEPLTFDDLLRFHSEVMMPEITSMITGRIDGLGGELEGFVSAKIDGVRTDLRGDMETLRADLSGNIEAVRTDFASHLTSEIGSVRADVRGFRGEFLTFRGDVMTHFDTIYHRLDSQASEYQALRAAVERLERQSPPAGPA